MQTQRVCFGHTRQGRSLYCLPTRRLLEPQGLLGIDGLVKANEVAAGIVNRLLNRDIDKLFLERLFSEDNFQSFSGAVRIEAVYGAGSLTYTPLHFIGAFKVSNPSLPEVHVAGLKQSVARLSHNLWFQDWAGSKLGTFLISPSVYHYDRVLGSLDTDLITTSTQRISDQIKTQTKKGVDVDVAFAFLSKKLFVPTLSLTVFNVAGDPSCKDCDQRFFDVQAPIRRSVLASASVRIPHPLGVSNVGVSLPYGGASLALDQNGAALAYRYWLSRLGAFASYGAMLHSFGFLFGGESYQIGIQYTDERQDQQIQQERKKQTYVFTSLKI